MHRRGYVIYFTLLPAVRETSMCIMSLYYSVARRNITGVLVTVTPVALYPI